MARFRIITDPAGLGLTLKEAMGRRNLRQLQAAQHAGLDQSQISRVLNGEARRFTPNIERLCKYAKLDCEPYLAPTTEKRPRLQRLVRAAGAGEAEREAIVAQILVLLAKLR